MSDDFSALVKGVLAARVGNLCSRPECRALTSGPQADPAKALNLGVAAHITAASPGGPRYDSGLLPEERSAPANGIWLCQNCAKLVDNDVSRFSVQVLKTWKADAEGQAESRIGKTAYLRDELTPHLDKGARVRISPIIPRLHEQSDFGVENEQGECFVLKKFDSGRQVEIPKSFIEQIHNFGNNKPALLQLKGRLQWVSAKRNFELFTEKPGGSGSVYGIGKDVDPSYVRHVSLLGRSSFVRESRLPQLLSHGWYVYYDLDGAYLRWPGPDTNQILIVDQV